MLNGITDIFIRELQNLIGKYSSLQQCQKLNIDKVVSTLNKLDIEGDLVGDLKSLIKLSEYLEKYPLETFEFYMWCNNAIGKSITIEEADEYVHKIEYSGYVDVEGILIFEDGRDLDSYIESLIENQLLTDVYHIKKLFDIEDIIKMWLDRTPFRNIIAELRECTLEELLDTEVKDAYITNEDKLIRYVEIDV